MTKDSYYFPHDYNAHNDPKLVKLSMDGWDLIGIYWAIVGMLHEQGGWMPNDPKTHAFALRVKEDRMAFVINFPDLFIIKDGVFTSKRVLKNLEIRHQKREKAQISASKRWNNANALRTHCDGNAIKERKGKEIKGKEIQKAIIFNFDDIWSKYPKRIGRKQAFKHFKASVVSEADFDNIRVALANYTQSERVLKGYVQNGATWFNNWKDWVDYKEEICKKCNNKGKYTSTTGYLIICDCPKGIM